MNLISGTLSLRLDREYRHVSAENFNLYELLLIQVSLS